MPETRDVPTAKRLSHGEQIYILVGYGRSPSTFNKPVGVLVGMPIGGAFHAVLDKEGILDFSTNEEAVSRTFLPLHECVQDNPNALNHLKVIDLTFKDKARALGEVAIGRTAEHGLEIVIPPDSNAAVYNNVLDFTRLTAPGVLKTAAPIGRPQSAPGKFGL